MIFTKRKKKGLFTKWLYLLVYFIEFIIKGGVLIQILILFF